MVTEKQVRDALGDHSSAESWFVDRLKAAGLISPEPDKPLLNEWRRQHIQGACRDRRCANLCSEVTQEIATRQAALDEFAREVEDARKLLAYIPTWDENMIKAATKITVSLSKARKAGLTRVGAQ